MTVATIKKKFPTSTVVALIVCGIVIFILLAYVFGFGGVLLGFGAWLLFDVFIGGLLWLATPQVAVALVIVSVIVFVWYYRKHYAKKKVLMPSTTGTIPAYDTLSKPLFDDDTKVESA